MTRDEWRAKAREEWASRPKYEPVTQGRLQALLTVARMSQKDADDEALLETSALWPDWTPGATYAAGDLVNHDGKLYRVVQGHTSQAHQPPNGAGMLALYNVVQLPPEQGQLLPWVAGEAVAVGDLRTYNGATYRCKQAHTTQAGWTPPAVASLWEKVN